MTQIETETETVTVVGTQAQTETQTQTETRVGSVTGVGVTDPFSACPWMTSPDLQPDPTSDSVTTEDWVTSTSTVATTSSPSEHIFTLLLIKYYYSVNKNVKSLNRVFYEFLK